MRKLLYILCQCTWGAIQSLLGALILLINLNRPHRVYHGAIVTEWRLKSSLSLGMFIFLAEDRKPLTKHKLLVHEYGHTVQSLMLGPLYLVVIGLPSVIWAGFPPFRRLRSSKHISYYWLYTERFANYLGEKITKERSFK